MFKRTPDRFQMQQEPEGMHYEWTVYTKQLKQLWLKYLGHCGPSTAPQDFSTGFTYYKTCVSLNTKRHNFCFSSYSETN